MSAGASSGFYYETLGGAALLLAGGGLFVLSGARGTAPGVPPPRRTARSHAVAAGGSLEVADQPWVAEERHGGVG